MDEADIISEFGRAVQGEISGRPMAPAGDEAEAVIQQEVVRGMERMAHTFIPKETEWGSKLQKARERKRLAQTDVEMAEEEEEEEESGVSSEESSEAVDEIAATLEPVLQKHRADAKTKKNVEHKITPGNNTNSDPIMLLHLTRNILGPAYEQIQARESVGVDLGAVKAAQQKQAQDFVDGLFDAVESHFAAMHLRHSDDEPIFT